jgi:hypothetical protein
MMVIQSGRQSTAATSEDVKNILGEIDTGKLMAIMSLKPTLAEVETASIWLAGDADVFGAGEPIKGTASEIVGILTADEEEPPPAA